MTENTLSSESSIQRKIFAVRLKNIIATPQFKRNVRQYTMVMALVLISLIFMGLTEGIFISARNISNLFLQTTTLAILATGLVLVVVSGHLDLSLGSVAGFSGAVAAVLQVNYGWSTAVVIPATLILGLLIGVWHGFWIAYRKVSALIVTLGSMLIFRGAMIGVTGGATIGPFHNDFKFLGQGYLPSVLLKSSGISDTSILAGIIALILLWGQAVKVRRGKINHGFKVLGFSLFMLKNLFLSSLVVTIFAVLISYRGVSFSVIVVLVLAILFQILAEKTTFGRRIYAIGGNEQAAYLSGIDIKKHIMSVYMLMGMMASLAGLVFTARLNAATAAAGNMFELDAVAAAVIGGCSLAGGEGTIVGALIGALVMSSLDNGMSLMDMDVTYQYIIKGLILVLAVWIDSETRQKKN